MSKDDLESLFAFAGADLQSAPATGPSVLEEHGTQGPSVPPSDTALVLDQWSRRKGTEWNELDLGTMGSEPLFDDPTVAMDFRAAFFEPEPELASACTDPLRYEFVKTLLESPDTQEVRESTILNEDLTRIAFDKTVNQWIECLQEVDHRPPPPGGASAPPGGLSPEDRTAAMKAGTRAAREAKKETDLVKDACAMAGLDVGAPGSPLDPRRVAAVYKKVAKDPKLRRIAELAGKFRLVARAQQRRKASHGLDDVVGVTLAGDISRLVPTELMALADEDLEWDALRRLAEKAALCREWRATEPVGKGPIVVTVDESFSMNGEKEETAKALALTLAWIAQRQKRWCGLIAYSGNSGHRLLTLDPKAPPAPDVLLDWVTKFIGGGCSRDVPIVELPEFWKELGPPKNICDVILITDARVHFSAQEMGDFNAWKKVVQARVTGLIVRDEPGDLAAVCDEVWKVPAITPGCEAVETVLGI